VGSAIQFDGTASAGTGLSYFWTFGDGTSATGARPVKTYAASNVYTVTLTVTDYTGAQSVAATTATIGGARAVVPAGCFVNGFGNVVCGTTLSTNIAGCYATVAGWVCPGFVPGQVVSPQLLATASVFHPNVCRTPNYVLTPVCLDLR
ncbi:MAG: PKD domain-containing protein, partial [Dehalococcoidia bacterium]